MTFADAIGQYVREQRTGPQAFANIVLFNQGIWDRDPKRAKEWALKALEQGGFNDDHISRRVGNYEGQIMAIRAGWVDGCPYCWRGADEQDRVDIWRLNDAGAAALRAAGEPVPVLLPARDDWHSRTNRESTFQYCAYELERNGQPMLRLFKEAIPCGASWGMEPLLRRDDAIALLNYLNDWLKRTEECT